MGTVWRRKSHKKVANIHKDFLNYTNLSCIFFYTTMSQNPHFTNCLHTTQTTYYMTNPISCHYPPRNSFISDLSIATRMLNDLIQIFNFPTWILTVTVTVLLFWIYFFLRVLVFVLKWLSFNLEILIMWFSQFPLTFCKTQNEMLRFIT